VDRDIITSSKVECGITGDDGQLCGWFLMTVTLRQRGHHLNNSWKRGGHEVD
jgi:hypothetical protein